jgi:hypothetical protein
MPPRAGCQSANTCFNTVSRRIAVAWIHQRTGISRNAVHSFPGYDAALSFDAAAGSGVHVRVSLFL